ncbi:nucleotide sugar dehydrogenase [bacterium 3DAC]|nr:nucleotide sugar dehydrogenase [bacterium 3DAC]
MKVSIWGLGSVGLPLALTFTLKGADVIGIDVNEEHVENIRNGNTHIYEPFGNTDTNGVLKEVVGKKFFPTTDYKKAEDANYHLVTVGIPLDDNMNLIWTPLESALHNLGKILKEGDTVVLRATVVPGTTTGLAREILEKESGLKAGKDFYLAYAPERIAEGRAYEEFRKMPTLVGGINEKSREKAKEVLSTILESYFVEVSDPWIAEMSKVLENASRDVYIAVVNEMAKLAIARGLRPLEVIEAANTHPRVKLLRPGAGVGGHCIPNAFYYLKPLFDDRTGKSLVFASARQVNDEMPLFLASYIDQNAKALGIDKSNKVAILGLAMKDFSYDDRYSPALFLKKYLEEKGWNNIWAYDPMVPKRFDTHIDDIDAVLSDAKVVIITALQEGITAETVEKYISDGMLVLDTKGILTPVNNKKLKVVVF